MEPPKPGDKETILAKAPNATSEEYDEYQQLLSKRFSKEPKKHQSFAADPDESRLRELTKKLFGDQ